jgi:hypothetical protein
MRVQFFLVKSACVGIVAAVAAVASPQADGGSPVRIGLGFFAGWPEADLSSAVTATSAGFGFSLSFEWAPKEKHALRGRLEHTSFGKEEHYYYPSDFWILQGTAKINALMADYIYRSYSSDKGLFVFVGAGLANRSFKPDREEYGDPISGSDFAYSVGLGYNFLKYLGIEASLSSTPRRNDYKCNWVNLSFKCRFPMPGGAK